MAYVIQYSKIDFNFGGKSVSFETIEIFYLCKKILLV